MAQVKGLDVIQEPQEGKGSWGIYVQGGDDYQETLRLGAELSKHLKCPVHYPAWNKNIYECKCLILFPTFMVKYAVASGDWSKIDAKHRRELTA